MFVSYNKDSELLLTRSAFFRALILNSDLLAYLANGSTLRLDSAAQIQIPCLNPLNVNYGILFYARANVL